MFRTALLISTLTVSALALTPASFANGITEDTQTEVAITIEGISREQGKLMIAVFETEADYKSNSPVVAKMLPVNSQTVSLTLDLEEGEYGIKLFHDVNSDGKLNTGMFGIPNEPYGFSNNAPVRFGPPSWSAAKFAIQGESATQTINLK